MHYVNIHFTYLLTYINYTAVVMKTNYHVLACEMSVDWLLCV